MKQFSDIPATRLLELAQRAGLRPDSLDLRPQQTKHASDKDCLSFAESVHEELLTGVAITDVMLERIDELARTQGGFNEYTIDFSTPGATFDQAKLLESSTKSVMYVRFAYGLAGEYLAT